MIEIKHCDKFVQSEAWLYLNEALHELQDARVGVEKGGFMPAWDEQVILAKSCKGGYFMGFSAYTIDENTNTAHISLTWVKPEFRNRGISKLLWETLVTRLNKANIAAIITGVHVDNDISNVMQSSRGCKPLYMMYKYDLNNSNETVIK